MAEELVVCNIAKLDRNSHVRTWADLHPYETAVRRVTPVTAPSGTGLSRFRVEVEHLGTQTTAVYFARNVVCAVGGRPRRLAHGADQALGVVHASEFLLRFPTLFPHPGRPYVFAIAGAGQSAGEIAAYLHRGRSSSTTPGSCTPSSSASGSRP